MYINNMKISTRLYAAFGFLISLLLGVMAVAIHGMAQMDGASDEITTNWMPSIEQANIMNTRASDIRIAESLHVLNTDDKKMAAIELELGKMLGQFEKAHQAYIPMISSPEERAVYQPMIADWQKYLEKQQEVLGHSRRGETEVAQAELQQDSRVLFEKATAGIQAIVDFNQKGGYHSAHNAKATYHQSRQIILLMGLVAVALAAFSSVLLVRSVTKPLRKAVEVAESVAEGDLTFPIFTQAQDETGVLMRALKRMQSNLVQSVTGVRHNAVNVSNASAEIAQGNMDLSARTESQASSLEQTAASMEQLSAQVKQNADSAREASNLASNASTVATRGGEVMGRVVTTMKEINDSSRRISDIISVIDGIAFQTNILALNAAVEAARAGDQGRGFAVVASEVRSLAGRSADAAKEIKTLISASVNRVEQGTALVDEAGSTMGEVVASIKRVTDLVSEINSSSREQAAGVAQAGEAVSQMDRVTQQNASMVEEMANAAANLKAQAHDLVETVAVFKLEKAESQQRLLSS